MRSVLVAAAISATLVPLAQGNVSIKNGNFFIGYTDIVYPGGFEPKIERVYNSKTPFRGMFGWGWGNEYEVYLAVAADGSVVVHEYGGGAENRFIPKTYSAKELDGAVEMIAKTAQQVGGVGSAAQLAEYKSRLKGDAEFRNKEWEKFRSQGRLKPRQLAEGATLTSNRFSFQYIRKVKDGYFRVFDNGRMEKFSDEGKLIKIQDKNNNSIDLTYGKDGKLQRLVDNFNRKMFFAFNTQGLLEKIEGENGKIATFKYNSAGELIASKDVDGNAYTFKYDSKGHHNMTEIGYSDKTTMAMTYYGPDKFENIKSVKDRDNTVTEYGYELSSGNRDQYAVTVAVRGSDGKVISNSKYEYFLKRRADGEEWTHRLVTTLDGDRTDTVYQEGTGLPLTITRGKEITQFEYDAKGHVTKKTTPNEVTELQYDPKVSKVTYVNRYPRGKKTQGIWSKFQYDPKGNLVSAQNSDKKAVRLFYDTNGRIKSMVDQNKRQIQFKYNENSKPIQITDPALGSITVSYTNSGEIKKVDSTAGRKIAVQVTSAFQNLLDIIRPAGVSLSF
jgi:YD repeat-containing protein